MHMAAAHGHPMELCKRVRLGKLAGGLLPPTDNRFVEASARVRARATGRGGKLASNAKVMVLCSPLFASAMNGHAECVQLLLTSMQQESTKTRLMACVAKVHLVGSEGPRKIRSDKCGVRMTLAELTNGPRPDAPGQGEPGSEPGRLERSIREWLAAESASWGSLLLTAAERTLALAAQANWKRRCIAYTRRKLRMDLEITRELQTRHVLEPGSLESQRRIWAIQGRQEALRKKSEQDPTLTALRGLHRFTS